MLISRGRAVRNLAMGASAFVALTLSAATDVPRGWMLAGSKPADYEASVDRKTVHEGQPSAVLKDKQGNSEGFGTLMQQISAVQYQGQRLRLSGYVKSEEVKNWAGLWMRVDKEGSVSAFDNMQERAIQGTTGWQKCEVVLDVEKRATGIAFGILLTGSGRVWLSGTKLEVVTAEVPTTGGAGRVTPVNLDFTE